MMRVVGLSMPGLWEWVAIGFILLVIGLITLRVMRVGKDDG